MKNAKRSRADKTVGVLKCFLDKRVQEKLDGKVLEKYRECLLSTFKPGFVSRQGTTRRRSAIILPHK